MGDAKSDKLSRTIYEDVAAPAVREVGSTLAGVIRAALSPINLTILTFDQAYEWAAEAVIRRFEKRHAAIEQIAQPDPNVVLPAVAAIQTATQELRELFANLIASSLEISKGPSVHPAFVDVLKQLSPADARVLATVFRNPGWYVLEVEAALDKEAVTSIHATNLDYLALVAGLPEKDNVQLRIDNLIRLGLIQRVELVPFGRKVSEAVLAPAFDEKAVQRALSGYIEGLRKQGRTPQINRTYRFATTEFGEVFCACCIADHDFGLPLIAESGFSLTLRAVIP